MPELEDDEEWEVEEEIKGEQKFDGDPHFLVKWKGWPSEYNQWVPEADMGNAQEAIARFRRSQKKGKKKDHALDPYSRRRPRTSGTECDGLARRL